ncbi:Golgi-associated plant pathogenesis-related protein 1 isoform X1 [Homo sapiens]|uniref:Golgi-associated plant pathogenesis-related protein 1 isoform X1 n=1 Tax=Homo sapiens TaxID=9606 RepID=UPI001FB11A4C|nr:Golgi-associated plant pathogenesis-related protein 1 isoform X1 [Homo sapiens]XP_054217996.1 Golgi-associated plant pathogenesis-related protein 1 isoform X1 [Homo sapiens]
MGKSGEPAGSPAAEWFGTPRSRTSPSPSSAASQNLYRASSGRGLASRRNFENPVQPHLGHLYPPPQQRQPSPFPQPWGARPRAFSSSDLYFKSQVWPPGNLHSAVPDIPLGSLSQLPNSFIMRS